MLSSQKLLYSRKIGYLFLFLPFTILAVIRLYPMLRGILLSFTDFSLLSPKDVNFIGFQNFKKALTGDKEFYSVIYFSVLYTFSVVLLSYVFGLFLAFLLNKDIKLKGLFRVLILLPWVIPPAVAATNWLWLLNDQNGLVNLALLRLGIIDSPILFFASKEMARFTAIMFGTWKSMPFMMIVLLSGLQTIPSHLYESAVIDGAGVLRQFFRITLPLLRNVSIVCISLMFIWTFNDFEQIYLLTEGGPINATYVLPIYSYFLAFFRLKMGYSSAISVIALFFLSIVSTINVRQQRDNF